VTEADVGRLWYEDAAGDRVYGGTGSVAVDVQVLQALAARAEGAARTLPDPWSVTWGLSGEGLDPLLLPGRDEPTMLQQLTGGPTTDAVASARARLRSSAGELSRAVSHVSERLHSLARSLRTAATFYAESEQRAMELSAWLTTTSAVAMVGLGMATGHPPDERFSAASVRALRRFLMMQSFGLVGGDGLEALMGQTAKAAAGLGPEQAGDITTGRPQAQAQLSGAEFLGEADGEGHVMQNLLRLQAASAEGTGSLLITRTGPEENPTWIVTVPGTNTTDGSVWGTLRIPEAMSGDSPHVQAAVLAALHAVGAKRGARVVLNGHSQGGAHALNLASAPELEREYAVSGVVTAGAPGGNRPTREGLPVIQLEDADDMVPGLDGVTTVPTSADRVLVRSAAGQPSAPQNREGKAGILGYEHRAANYQDLAERVDADTGKALPAAIGALRIKGDWKTYRVPTTGTTAAPAPGQGGERATSGTGTGTRTGAGAERRGAAR